MSSSQKHLHLDDVTNVEYLDSFKKLILRLNSHIHSFDSGEFYVRDDIANILRAILTSGKGEDALMQVCNRFKLIEPRIVVSDEASNNSSVFFSFGSLPTKKGIVVNVPSELRELRCGYINFDNEPVSITWGDLIKDYANTWGAHISRTIPKRLSSIKFHGAAGMDIGSYMLRAIGVAVRNESNALIKHIEPRHQYEEISLESQGLYFDEANILKEGSEISLVARLTTRPRQDTEVLRTQYEDRTHAMGITVDGYMYYEQFSQEGVSLGKKFSTESVYSQEVRLNRAQRRAKNNKSVWNA